MRNSADKQTSASANVAHMPVREIIRTARVILKLNQTQFAERLETSQSLISKYESGNTNPPTGIIDECIKIIHGKNTRDDVSLAALEARMRKVLKGPAHTQARKAFAVLLDSMG